MKKIILASTSPRRRHLLKEMGIDFDVIKPSYEEHMENKSFSYELIENIAENKCDSVINTINEDAIIISADTVVIHSGKVLGKPKDYDEAFSMLSELSGNEHMVVTAICIFDTDSKQKIIKTETSKVIFNNIEPNEIQNYINTYKPYDKAGSYGIQELPAYFIKEIKGEYDNIVGLPCELLKTVLKEIKNNNT